MSVANIIPAVALLGGIVVIGGSATLRSVLPSSPPIEIHSLTYENGMVTQNRTVRGEGDVVLLTWSAQVIDSATGSPVPGCTGSGAWPFETGPREMVMPLDRWVGSISCIASILPSGQYHLLAAWRWGEGHTTFRSDPFEVTR